MSRSQRKNLVWMLVFGAFLVSDFVFHFSWWWYVIDTVVLVYRAYLFVDEE